MQLCAILHDMKTWTNEFLQMADQPHKRRSPRSEGEASLVELAMQSEVEYAWEHEEKLDLWRYVPATNVSRKVVENGLVTESYVGLTLNNRQIYPHSNSSTFYHIHPLSNQAKTPLRQFEAIFPVSAQLPSDEDINAFVSLGLNGYKGFKIVTALGVTAVSLDRHIFEPEDGVIRLPGINLGATRSMETVSRKGVSYAIQETFDLMNTHYADKIRFDFTKIDLDA